MWYNTKKLEKKLINDGLPEKLGYLFLVIFLSAVTIVSLFSNYSSGSEEIGITGIIITMGISIWGILKAFEINRSAGNKDFLKRFLYLSFFSGIKLIAYLFAFSIVLRGLKLAVEIMFPSVIEGAILGDVSKMIIASSASALFFIMLINSFKRINEEEDKLRPERV